MISGVNLDTKSVTVEWYENGETKGKEVKNELHNREVKFDIYGKRQTAKIKLLPSVFSSLYSRIKVFVFAVNSKRYLSIFCMIYLRIT